jgi:hypothetical protein
MAKSTSAEIPSAVRSYFAEIGSKGGRQSRRTLTSEQSKAMLRVREARRAFKQFRALCFWSYDPDLKITIDDIEWIVRTLRKNGNRRAWEVADYLCR